MQQLYEAHRAGRDNRLQAVFVEGDAATNTVVSTGPAGCKYNFYGQFGSALPYPFIDTLFTEGFVVLPASISFVRNKVPFCRPLNAGGEPWESGLMSCRFRATMPASLITTPVRNCARFAQARPATPFSLINLGAPTLMAAPCLIPAGNGNNETATNSNNGPAKPLYGEASIASDSLTPDVLAPRQR